MAEALIIIIHQQWENNLGSGLSHTEGIQQHKVLKI